MIRVLRVANQDLADWGQLIIQHVPLGADFVGTGLFRLQRIGVEGRAASARSIDNTLSLATLTVGATARRGRRTDAGINAAIRLQLVNHTQLVVQQVIVTAEGSGAIPLLSPVTVIAQASIDQPLLVERNSVKRIKRGSVGLVMCKAAITYHMARPRIATVRVIQAGTHIG